MGKSSSDEVFEVEKIVGHRITKKNKAYSVFYEIKWLNYNSDFNTWERESNVYAPDMIVKYWASLPKSNKDRVLFEGIQSRKKKPIKIPSNTTTNTEPKKKASTKRVAVKQEPKRLPLVIANDISEEEDEEDEEDLTESDKKGAIKRKSYSDYFLQEHERKKLKEGLTDMNWDSQAELVEFIGKESPEETQYQCRIKWKDGVRTMHPLSLVREKRPDLVIDRFLLMLDEQQ